MLDQKPFTVVAVVVTGTVSAEPALASIADPVAIEATARNIGNLAGSALPFRLRVLAADGANVVREWNYTSDLAIGAQIARSESIAAGSLPLGQYLVRWSVEVDGEAQPLAETSFSVMGSQISGLLDADRAVEIGEVVQLHATVRNTGNQVVDALPVRLDVRRQDTQAIVDSWNDTATIVPVAPICCSAMDRSHSGALRRGAVGAGRWRLARTGDRERRSAGAGCRCRNGLEILRDARVLVLATCAPGQSFEWTRPPVAGLTPAIPPDCATARKEYIDHFLTERGIQHKVVTDEASFMRALRCGQYNVYWLSGGNEHLTLAEARELRVGVSR